MQWRHMAACHLQAEACKTGTLYVVNIVSAQGSVLSEVAFNSETGCLGANTVQVGPGPQPASALAHQSPVRQG